MMDGWANGSGIEPAFVYFSFCWLERASNQFSDTEVFLLNASHHHSSYLAGEGRVSISVLYGGENLEL